MKKIAYAALASVAALALSACGSSDPASEGAQAENVEMPAEEAMGPVDPAAVPMADATMGATATATDPAVMPTDAAEAATMDAEKKTDAAAQ
jgi:hypothetical protein